MKVGENRIITFKMLELDITTVDKVIFTFSGIEKVEKEYPSEYVTFSEGRFFVGLTQQDTILISRNKRVKVSAEGQICYKNGAVSKTDIVTFMMEDSLNTTIIPGNSPSDNVSDIEFHFDGSVLLVGESAVDHMTPIKVRQIIESYNFADPSEISTAVESYVTEHEAELKGEPGENGADGKDGKDGTNGADGKSAYQIAVELGFTGTQAEWEQSLHGADGINGTNGTDGKTAYESALSGGYEGTEEQFNEGLAQMSETLTSEEMLTILRGGNE